MENLGSKSSPSKSYPCITLACLMYINIKLGGDNYFGDRVGLQFLPLPLLQLLLAPWT